MYLQIALCFSASENNSKYYLNITWNDVKTTHSLKSCHHCVCSASLPTYFLDYYLDSYLYIKCDTLKLQHFDVAGVNSLALVSQILAKHLLNLISDGSTNQSCYLF